ncbi:hypothetical protein GCM10010922_03010 [Microbacterium sorbitolivorans]|uniref:VWA domain-containing protein n=1 Tax=Microbacterium sorbitolivorans TaxID=1867410 RepID=A0A367Y6Q0_9MICO|nr:VWA domain-containing protein [Microbacterium sorbitolivorans]RCK61536.1 VWA domain-containing protein [Microbacterium sorbitolivorans]GGF31338.1 hypothetical protein GCM10010922_03010 [Microbacterium sorbitolivorans]
MTPILQPSGIISPDLQGDAPSHTQEVRLGFPGMESRTPATDILLFDDSWSLRVEGGNDPVGNRYAEARAVIEHLARWTHADNAQIAVGHFDHPEVALVGPHPFHKKAGLTKILDALKEPSGVVGSSTLLPVLQAAAKLARSLPEQPIRLTIFSDFELTDPNLGQTYEELARFPGAIHAVVLNADPDVRLGLLPNVTVTRMASDSPTGLASAALFQSLTAGRLGVHRPKMTTKRAPRRPRPANRAS